MISEKVKIFKVHNFSSWGILRFSKKIWKMTHPVKAPRPVPPRWKKKITKEASVEIYPHILLGQIFQLPYLPRPNFSTWPRCLDRVWKGFPKMKWFFSKIFKWSNSQNEAIEKISIHPTNSILTVDLAALSEHVNRKFIVGALLLRLCKVYHFWPPTCMLRWPSG